MKIRSVPGGTLTARAIATAAPAFAHRRLNFCSIILRIRLERTDLGSDHRFICVL